MKKMLCSLLVLGLGGAFAQTYAGGKVGGSNVFFGVGVGGGVDVRFDADFYLAEGLTRFDLGGDVLASLSRETLGVDFYAGGGPAIGYTSVAGEGEFDVYLQGLGGAEYSAEPGTLGLFGEVGLQTRLTNGFAAYPFFQTGFNVYF